MKPIHVLAPFSGRVIPLEDVPDPVFAERMVGDGLAIDPSEGLGVSPVSGRLTIFHSACHAFVVQVTGEVNVLVHAGLNTVELKGVGFQRLAEPGDEVKPGQEIVRFSIADVKAAGYSPLSPVILPDLPEGYSIEKTTAATVRAGEDILFTVTRPD